MDFASQVPINNCFTTASKRKERTMCDKEEKERIKREKNAKAVREHREREREKKRKEEKEREERERRAKALREDNERRRREIERTKEQIAFMNKIMPK